MRSYRSQHSSAGFTLVEIMIVIGILGIILSIASTTWMRQRHLARWRACQEQLVKIDGAKNQWAMEANMPGTAEISLEELVNQTYLKKVPTCPAGGEYTMGTVNQVPTCSVVDPYDHNAAMGN